MSSDAERRWGPRRVTPGPNAFAIAAKARLDGGYGQRENENEKRLIISKPLPWTPDNSHLLHTDPNQKDNSYASRGSAARGPAPSLRKPDVDSSMTSRHGTNTARSRQSDRSYRSAVADHTANNPVQIDRDDEKTARYRIEGKHEKRFFDMMGMKPGTPPGNVEIELVQAGRYRAGDKPAEPDHKKAKKAAKKAAQAIKSPRKKLFGMSFPDLSLSGFRSSANNPPVMPPKAEQILVTGKHSSPLFKRPDTPRAVKRQEVRSDTTKSLPSKRYGDNSHARRPSHHVPSSSRTQAKPTDKVVRFQDSEDDEHSGGPPPTPPQKNTPPDPRDRVGWAQEKLEQGWSGDKHDQAQDLHPGAPATYRYGSRSKGHRVQEPHPGVAVHFRDGSYDEPHPGKPVQLQNAARNQRGHIQEPPPGMPVQLEDESYYVGHRVPEPHPGEAVRLPDFLTEAGPIPLSGGKSPTKFCPFTAEDYAKLIEPHLDTSTRAQIEHDDAEIAELEGDEPEMQQIQPRFYSPSAFSVSLFDGGRPSQNTDPLHLVFSLPPRPQSSNSMRSDLTSGTIGIVFQGSASEIDPDSETGRMISAAQTAAQASNDTGLASRVMQELHGQEQGESSERAGGSDVQPMQPEPSSSKLTDMLDGLSPSKARYSHEFHPHYPSAMPSPLHGLPGQRGMPSIMGPTPASPPPPTSWVGTLPDGSNILTHFYMCNSHIDVTGRTLYDLAVHNKRNLVKAVGDSHGDIITTVTERFDDIKADISSLGEAVHHHSGQNKAVIEKLDKLWEFVKSELVELLSKQSMKNVEMENNIKSLQKSMQEMMKAMETKSNLQSVQAQAPNTGQSPFHPTMPNHRSQPSLVGFFDSPAEVPREPQRMTSIQEVRKDRRFRYGNNNAGQQSYRPSTAGRENGYPASNPYLANTSGQFGSGYMGAYGGYYPGGPSEHTFNYNPGAAK